MEKIRKKRSENKTSTLEEKFLKMQLKIFEHVKRTRDLLEETITLGRKDGTFK